MGKYKNLAKQTIVYGFGTIIPRLINYFLLTPFFTNIFSNGEYGVVTELYAYVAFLLVMLIYGMETTFFYFSEKEKNFDKVYSTAFFSLFTTSALFIFFVNYYSMEIAKLLDYPQNVEYIVWFGIIIGIDAFTTIPFAKLRKENRALRFATLKILSVCVNIILVFFFLWVIPKFFTDDQINTWFWFYKRDYKISYVFISNLITSIFTLLLLLPEILTIKLTISFKLLKQMYVYTFPLLIVGLAGMINEVADKFMLKFLLPDKKTALDMVGIYGANYKIAMIMAIFVQMFRYGAEPFFFSQSKQINSKDTYADIMKYFIIFGLTIFLVVVLYLDIIKYFIGKDFWTGLAVVPIVLIANLFSGIYYNLSVWYKVNNLTKFGAYIAISGAFITIICNVLLVPYIGYIGSAWATLICYVLMTLISFIMGIKYFKIEYEVKKLAFYFILAVILYFIKSLFNIDSLIYSLALGTFLLLLFLILVEYNEKLFIRLLRK